MKRLSLILICFSLCFGFMSCNDEEMGCTDPTADNYNPDATQDDGNCVISGCTDSLSTNYNPNANRDDGSCFISGCTDATAPNFNPAATSDDGSCETWVSVHIGDYNGSILCGGILGLVNSDAQEYSIYQDPDNVEGVIVEFDLFDTDITVTAKGIVEETKIVIDHTQEEVPYDPGIGTILVDMQFIGDLEFIDQDLTMSSGSVQVIATDSDSGQSLANDFCDLVLNKM